jgi:hypothetical protein
MSRLSKIIFQGKFAGLKITVRLSVLVALAILWMALTTISIWAIKLPVLDAIFGSLLATLLHPIAAFCHQFGHSLAARATGYPMSGAVFWGPISTSIYPPKERKLPAKIHVRRAVGGPTASVLMTMAAGVIALGLNQTGGTAWWVAFFFFLDNFLVFTLGALIPLRFTDGSTLLLYLLKRTDH